MALMQFHTFIIIPCYIIVIHISRKNQLYLPDLSKPTTDPQHIWSGIGDCRQATLAPSGMVSGSYAKFSLKRTRNNTAFFEVVGRQSHLTCVVKYLQIKLVYIYSRHVNIINHHEHPQNTNPIPSHMPGVLLYLASLFGISFHNFFVAHSWFVSWGFLDLSWSIPMWFKLLKLSGWCHWCPCWFHLNYWILLSFPFWIEVFAHVSGI